MAYVWEYIERLELIRRNIPAFVEKLAFSYQWHLVIITDVEIPFPKNYEWIGHDSNIELSDKRWNEHPNKGWSKPDKIFGDIELRYLWKQFKPNICEKPHSLIKN